MDKEYELSVWADGTTEERSYVGSAVIYRKGGAREVRYQHLDRLGSLDAVTAHDAAATELLQDAHGFDPWGKPRGREWTSSQDRLHPAGDLPAQGATTDRGFTGHEHLDVHWLIHMNGRVYDYRLGRFLSVDPIIGNPANPQAVNPYSYIGNNPLSGTDPTGYMATTTGTHVPGAVPTGNPWINGSPLTGAAIAQYYSSGSSVALALAERGDALALEVVERGAAPEPAAPASVDERITQALAAAGGPVPLTALRTACRVRNATLRERLAALTAAGQLVRAADGYWLAAG